VERGERDTVDVCMMRGTEEEDSFPTETSASNRLEPLDSLEAAGTKGMARTPSGLGSRRTPKLLLDQSTNNPHDYLVHPVSPYFSA